MDLREPPGLRYIQSTNTSAKSHISRRERGGHSGQVMLKGCQAGERSYNSNVTPEDRGTVEWVLLPSYPLLSCSPFNLSVLCILACRIVHLHRTTMVFTRKKELLRNGMKGTEKRKHRDERWAQKIDARR